MCFVIISFEPNILEEFKRLCIPLLKNHNVDLKKKQDKGDCDSDKSRNSM